MKRKKHVRIESLVKSHLFHYFYSSIGLIISVVLILVFQKIAGSLAKPRLLYVDETVHELFRFVASPTTDFISSIVTFFGSSIFITFALCVSAFIFYKNKLKRASFVLVFSTVSAILIDSLLKSVFIRTRPMETGDTLLWQDYSFPSGHAMLATVFYTILGYLIIRFEKNSSRKLIYALFFFGLILSVSMSRVALGYHYFSDIVAAMAIGGFWAIWNIYIIKILYKK